MPLEPGQCESFLMSIKDRNAFDSFVNAIDESLFEGEDRQGALSKRKQARTAQALRPITTVAPDERRLPALPGPHLPQFYTMRARLGLLSPWIPF